MREVGSKRIREIQSAAQALEPPPSLTTQQFAETYRHFGLGTPWFHKEWYAAMDDPELRRVFIMGPRLHAKTSCALTYALRRLCEDHNLRIGILSQTDGLAKHFLGELKYELQANVPLVQTYGPDHGRGTFVGDKWTEHEILLSDARDGERGLSGKDVSVFSVGRGGQITGYHCDLLIVDDLETKEGTDSDTVRQGTREWWSREVEPVLAPGGKILATGCLASGTPVLMADGTWRAIEQVGVGEQVWTVDPADQFVTGRPSRVDAVLDQGIAEVIEVRTRTSSLRATVNHPFLVRTYVGRGAEYAKRGKFHWVRAGDLRVGDYVVETKEVEGKPQNEWADEEFAWLLGYLFGDGWAMDGDRLFWCALGTNEEMNERVLVAMRGWFPMVTFARTPFGYIRATDTRDGAFGERAGTVVRGSSVYGASRVVTQALADMGLGSGAKGKRVPEWMFKSPLALRVAFLRGICDADGNWDTERGGAVIELANEGLIGDLRQLALTSGVRPGGVKYRAREYGQRKYDSWSLRLNFRYVGRPDGVGGRGRSSGKDHYGVGTEFRLTAIESVTPVAHEQVWDLTVEGTHTFVADGVVTHNTRKHFDDIYSYWLQPGSGWKVIDVVKSVFRADGSPIWPEMWSLEALMARKASMDHQDLLAWSQEYLNLPRPTATQMFYPDAWPTYQKAPHGLTYLQFWDLAISERTTADYTVGWTVGVSEANDVYLLDIRRGHWDFNTTLAEIEGMGRAWPGVQAVGIEQVAYQAAAVQEAMRRTMLPIVPVVPDKDKVTRARLLEARAAGGKVYRPKEAAWWPEFALEASFFPAGSHDDQIDALAGAVRLAGFEATSIDWAYSVIQCAKCQWKFVWEANRPCPKCGTKAPPTYENPELAAYQPAPEGGNGHLETVPVEWR